jgi:hypothetical protein
MWNGTVRDWDRESGKQAEGGREKKREGGTVKMRVGNREREGERKEKRGRDR